VQEKEQQAWKLYLQKPAALFLSPQSSLFSFTSAGQRDHGAKRRNLYTL